MLWMIFILLFILERNGVVVPQVAWVLAWTYVGVTVLNAIIKVLENRDKNDKNK